MTKKLAAQALQLWRLIRLGAHLLLGIWLCALILPRRSSAARQQHIRKWSLALLKIFGVSVEYFYAQALHDEPGHALDAAAAAAAAAATAAASTSASAPSHEKALQPGVIVANHLSWLDVFVINAVQPCRFVAKAEIRTWPLLGYLCRSTRTIFISRNSARDVRNIFQQLAESIRSGDHVAFFPEGTVAAQGKLLPFHANLFEAAIDAGVPIQPVALRYLNLQDKLHAEIDYTGDITFGQSLLRVLRSPAIQAHIILTPAIASDYGNRRALAAAAQRSIAVALNHPPFEEGA